MDKLKVKGGVPLHGTIGISGAKNAALPLMTASLLMSEPLVLSNVPDLADIKTMTLLLEQHGVSVTREGDQLRLEATSITSTTAPYDIVRKMRASILVLGPLVARAGEAYVSLPGGCAIGTRPVDLHVQGLEALGAQVTLEEGYIHVLAPKGLTGADYTFPIVSVTGTENLMMAATLAKGRTRLMNAAQEPEVVDLARCLRSMGAHIEGEGTSVITIHGGHPLKQASHRVISDRIEAGSYAVAAAITQGSLTLKGIQGSLLPGFLSSLKFAGIHVEEKNDSLFIDAQKGVIKGVDIFTDPFPGFATDLQAQFMALMTLCSGASRVTESIFENRFMHVPELVRMGADISVHGGTALVKGTKTLRGAPVMATDLRASISLVLAGLAAEGETIINRIYHLDRGYEKVEEKLSACGAQIERVE